MCVGKVKEEGSFWALSRKKHICDNIRCNLSCAITTASIDLMNDYQSNETKLTEAQPNCTSTFANTQKHVISWYTSIFASFQMR